MNDAKQETTQDELCALCRWPEHTHGKGDDPRGACSTFTRSSRTQTEPSAGAVEIGSDAPGLPPGESDSRDEICDALAELIRGVAEIAEGADESPILDIRREKPEGHDDGSLTVRGLLRFMTTCDPGGRDGAYGELVQRTWGRVGRALNSGRTPAGQRPDADLAHAALRALEWAAKYPLGGGQDGEAAKRIYALLSPMEKRLRDLSTAPSLSPNPEPAEYDVPEARDMLALFKLAAMDGYNKKPVSTVDEWVEECKKRMLLLYLAGRQSAGAAPSGEPGDALPPHTKDFGAPGHPKHWCERCRIEAERAAPSAEGPGDAREALDHERRNALVRVLVAAGIATELSAQASVRLFNDVTRQQVDEVVALLDAASAFRARLRAPGEGRG